jgi:hypothetical protein
MWTDALLLDLGAVGSTDAGPKARKVELAVMPGED